VAHAVQYLWITAYYARATRGWTGATPFLARTFAAGAAVWTLPAIVFAPRWLGAGGVGYETGLALLIAAAINLHHFVLDGAIWKLRDGPIARVLIRSESAAEAPDARAPGAWRRRATWALAAGCAAIAVFVFAAEFFLVPRAIASENLPRAGALLDVLALVGRDSARSRGQLAELATEAGRFEEGAAQFERSAALAPMPEVYASIVVRLALAGRLEEAASHCDELLALAPDDANAHRLVAAVYERLGRAGRCAGAARARPDARSARAGLLRAAHAAPGRLLIRGGSAAPGRAVAQVLDHLRQRGLLGARDQALRERQVRLHVDPVGDLRLRAAVDRDELPAPVVDGVVAAQELPRARVAAARASTVIVARRRS
jgi:tetratricopeptide (TPR) repeat protein